MLSKVDFLWKPQYVGICTSVSGEILLLLAKYLVSKMNIYDCCRIQ